MTEINTENIFCQRVPVFAKFRESGRKFAGRGDTYAVNMFSHGLVLPAEGAMGAIQTKYDAAALCALPALPPVKTDDTLIIRKAIAEHRVIYVPMGRYVVNDTILLCPDTVLIVLHPDETQFDLLDRAPGFQGPGTPRLLLQTPQGGHNIVTGLGILTNGISSRAVGVLWMSGQDSLMDDVRFLGGHGTSDLDGKRLNPYNNTHTSDPDIHRRWDA